MIPQCEDTFRVKVRNAQRTVVPYSRDAGLSLFHEGKSQERAALHGVGKGAAAFRGLGHLLKLANRFFEQAHLAEGNTKVVVRLEVFLFRAHFAQLRAKFVEDFLERTMVYRARCAWRRGRSLGRVLSCHRRRGSRIGVSGWRREVAKTKLVDLVGEVGEKLIGSKALIRCGGRRGAVAYRRVPVSGLWPRGRRVFVLARDHHAPR